MEQSHRDIIDNNCEKIIQRIDMIKLFPKLLEYKIYNIDDVNISKWIGTLDSLTTARDIFLRIKTRGPKAFERLLLSLRQTNHRDISDILDGKIQQDNNSIQHLTEKRSSHGYTFYQDIQRSNEPLKVKVRKSTRFVNTLDSNVISLYPMQSNPRGLVLLITNIHYNWSDSRHSAEHDEKNLKELFEQMGFKVISKKDLTGKGIKDTVRAFSTRSDLIKVDSCFVIISSHGTEDKERHTQIDGVDFGREDAEKILCIDILDYFTADACPQMANKPKIFIFQLCRGLRKQDAICHKRSVTDSCGFFPKDIDEELESDNTVLSDEGLTRNYDDTLVAYSTLPGHVAYRDCTTGSWFIQILCRVFMTLAYRVHIQDLFSIIDAQLQHLKTTDNNCQTSCVKVIGFNKHCYLNPGYFANQN